MMDALVSLPANTVEYQGWGLNALTASFFVSIVLTAVTGWGLIQQTRTIWRRHAAEAVSVIWISYYTILQLVILTYGYATNSAALMINGLLALLYFPIVVGLWKFKGFSNSDKLGAAVFLVALGIMILTSYKPLFFLGFAVGGLISAAAQPLEMWRKKSAKGLDLKLIGTVLFGTVVWFVYGVAVADWVLITINAIAFFIFSTILYLARRYKTHAL